MTYRIEIIPMTLSFLQGHSYFKSFKCDFFRTAMLQLSRFQLRARRAVPLR